MARAAPFQFYIPAGVFEKAKPGGGVSRRIGGIVSTDGKDQDGETLLRSSMDFGPFERRGYFNDNHGKSTSDVVGYPTAGVKWFGKKALLPDGTRATQGGFWAEGVLVGERGRQIWQIAEDLKGSGRSLGFSVQGKILERDLLDRAVVRRAVVEQVAVTHCPVNASTQLVTLSKALRAGSAIGNPGAAPGVGFALRTESLDPDVHLLEFSPGVWPSLTRTRRRLLGTSDGVAYIKSIYPGMGSKQATALYRLAGHMKALGAVQRGTYMKRMNYGDYSAKCDKLGKSGMAEAKYKDLDDEAYAKAVEFGDDEENEDKEEEEEGEEATEKGGFSLDPTEEDLLKSLELLTALADSAETATQTGRMAELGTKAAEGTLSKSERSEMAELLAEDEVAAGAGEDLHKSLTEDDEATEALDASPFLAVWSGLQEKALDGLSGEVVDLRKSLEQGREADTQFQGRLARSFDALAKSLVGRNVALREELGTLRKSNEALAKRVAGLAGSPMPWQGRTPQTRPEQVVKSQRDGLDLNMLGKSGDVSTRVAFDTIKDLMEKSADSGDSADVDRLGTALFSIERNMRGDWRKVRGMTPAIAERVVTAAQSAR